MNAIDLLTNKIDVERLLHHYRFDEVHSDGDMIRACCKIHGGSNPSAFVANRDNGLWYCHTGGCGGGDAFTLVQLMEEIDFKDAVHWIAKFFDVDITNLAITERKLAHVSELKKWIKAVKAKRTKEVTEFKLHEKTREVTKYRKFQESTLSHFGLKYVERITLNKRDGSEYVLNNRLIFPITIGGIQVGISIRRIKKTDFPKWSHQPINMETKNIIYNFDEVKGASEIVVCEGITDVWAFHEIGIPAVAMFGAHITDEQYRMLLKTGADLTFAFDNDDAGIKATNKAIELFRNKANVRVIHFDNGEDPESIEREDLMQRYANRRRCI